MDHTCRGTVSLHSAIIHTEDSCSFVINNGATRTFHIKAANEVERQKWVTALELAKTRAIRSMENGEKIYFRFLLLYFVVFVVYKCKKKFIFEVLFLLRHFAEGCQIALSPLILID